MASLSMDSVTGAHARRWSLSALLRWLQAPIAPQSTALVRDDTTTAGPAKPGKRHGQSRYISRAIAACSKTRSRCAG